MKKILGLVIAVLASLSMVGTVAAAPVKPSYCGSGAYNASYRAVYQYPTGSYWKSQIAAYPDYYAATNAYYLANYGC